ncbi:signal recognition particle protein [Desulfomonile tiedjei]|uniref:Signal recognition particle protein n=1 Tax=Desulfomonile tiedjei (strain ATCC 49306 / DSM 6799 / DCB-1) TaxID=706587 RepID=I4C7R2_DESTA|nr:signal recognition particle protein [Desulfomonile tiedjei]AFM25603.1 signal recognition particle subunit FFH/SRP54 (srp54) [Desulfomonile tiedjei DSM 6799]
MLEILTRGFRDVRQYLQGVRTLNEENLSEALAMIRVSLLEADVEFQVTRSFLEKVKEQALGEIVHVSVKFKERKLKVSPGDHFIKLCHDELVRLMGPEDASLDLRRKPVSAIMMVGLQGSGKTTTAAKLARFLQKKGNRPMLVAADVYRPAAVDQIRKLGADLNVPVYSDGGARPPEICSKAMQIASDANCDVVIFDTAGRLTIDEPLMEEIHQIEELAHPDNVLLVCDAMIGQESVNIAKAFNERIRLTGFILTKLDGDARGGAAISIKEATGVPIKFVGMGEGMDRLEEFRPDGLASRILGFGDVVGLVKDFEEVLDEKKAEEDAMRMLRGEFGFGDFLEQIRAIKKMGPLQDLIEKLPFFPGGLPSSAKVDDYELVRIESIINSMTPAERKHPDIINQSRIARVARGSGREEREVKDLLTKFRDMRDLMSAMGGGKIRGRWKGMKGLRKMFGGGFSGMGSEEPAISPNNPFGLPEIKKGNVVSKKALEKQRKKSKQAKQARKKARKK